MEEEKGGGVLGIAGFSNPYMFVNLRIACVLSRSVTSPWRRSLRPIEDQTSRAHADTATLIHLYAFAP